MALFQKPCIGLDISDRSVEAVYFVSKRGRPTLASYGRLQLPPGLVQDGAVLKRAELAVMIRKLLADQMAPPLPNGVNRVVLALPETQVFSHVFEVPRLADEAHLREALEIEADGIFPFNHDELVNGETVISRRPDKKEVFFAAVRASVLDGFIETLKEAKLVPVAIESEPTSIARAVIPAGQTAPVALVDIGARVTHVSIFDENGIQFSETLETAGDAFTAALAVAQGGEAAAAEEVKKRDGLHAGPDGAGGHAIAAQLDRLIAEIREALAFYARRSSRPVQHVLLCGGSAAMPGLPEYFTERLPDPEHPVDVGLADPWIEVAVDPLLERMGVRSKGVLVATAIGLGLRGLNLRKFPEIDFLESARREAAPKKRFSFSLKLPTFRKSSRALPPAGKKPLPHGLKVGMGVAAVLGLVAFVWLAVFRIAPMFRQKPAVVATGLNELAIDLPIDLGPEFAPERRALNAVAIDLEETFTREVDREGERVDGFAKGAVRIVNTTGAAQPLVERTRLLAADGTLFRLDARVTVPANGSANAAVTADQPGASGDVPAGRFTIPGLSSALQARIYGESEAAFTGGSTFVGAELTEEELETERAALLETATERLYAQAEAGAGDRFSLVPQLYGVLESEIVEAPKAGTSVGDFSLSLRVRARALVVSRDELDEAIRLAIQEQAPEGDDAAAYAYDDPEITVLSADIAGETAALAVRTVARK